jgi:lipopolysaccharide biosynthesis glycosyltransferase
MHVPGKTNPPRVAVLYVADERYHSLTELSVASVALLHKSPVDFHLVQVDYQRPVNSSIEGVLQDRGHSLEHSFLSAAAVKLPPRIRPKHAHISGTSSLKAIAIDQLAARYERIVYIDGDVVLFTAVDFGAIPDFSTVFAAVYDFVSYMNYDGHGLSGADGRILTDYFNAGLLVVNSANWRRKALLEKYHANLAVHEERCPYFGDYESLGSCKSWDQCVMNMTAQADWTPLPLLWNAQRPVRHTAVWKDAYLRHYTGPKKFTPLYRRSCDQREYKHLRWLEKRLGQSIIGDAPYDGGVLFFVDRLRYSRERRAYNAIIDRLEQRMLENARAT